MTTALGVLLVLVGIVLGCVALFAAGNADRTIDVWSEEVVPVLLWGGIPVALGIVLIVWG